MTFRPIEAAPGRNSNEISVSVKSCRGQKPRVRVCFHEQTLRQLGWKEGMMILPLAGEGQDHGMVKLQATDRKGFRLTRPPRSETRLQMVFPAPQGSPLSFYSQAAEYRLGLVDRSVTLRLPWTERVRSVA